MAGAPGAIRLANSEGHHERIGKTKTDPYRRQLLGKVHIAKKTLGLDDDSYRDLLEAQTGKRSAAKCSNVQLVNLVEHFKSQGFKLRHKTKGERPLHVPGVVIWRMVKHSARRGLCGCHFTTSV